MFEGFSMQESSGGHNQYREYLQVLKACSPYDFSGYSNNSIERRIDKIMRDNNLNLDQLIYRTRTSEEFVEYVVESITVNTTELFRDPPLWIDLYQNVLPALIDKPKIHIWHAGCSTGQEVYSNIILLHQLGLLEKSEIYASDISRNAISQAKKGSYRFSYNYESYFHNFKRIFPTNTNALFEKFFSVNKSVEDSFSIHPEFIEKVKFLRHDLVKEAFPAFSKFDVIFCRNVLIYFNEDLQNNIVQKFYERLFPGGFLILGSHESLHGFFKTKFVHHKQVYKKTSSFHLKY
ncbi:CheR family methyltransferase [Geofilum sp. OHC36d9]|uniref:CheR family methyltransferase n=1 Tax=Geofilum sp. OHC36d9 TaxID=3458413 RepID=UPI00403438BF